ncbi:hypothetical protein CLV92_1198 [Kineococcus xinjiangensis]|uniref:Uncharacterized protein n=1 Tax=Kineococcus xinjiangensis TaxID=512762 RepID=A0A2S6ICK7_9ACTN|nr:hypothetical protein [Kineococcus xinjiangensis]PPK91927.1 hypothetical protein CLV92_1198 [Kineococcus xinjiangensis]
MSTTPRRTRTSRSTAPSTGTPTAAASHVAAHGAARDAHAAMLRQLGDHASPCSGDRVRFVYEDGTTLQGTWTFLGARGPAGPFALVDDDGAVHVPPAGHVRCDIAKDRVALLTVGEVVTLATVLEELAAMCPGHPLEDVAREQARSIADRFLFARDNTIPTHLPAHPPACVAEDVPAAAGVPVQLPAHPTSIALPRHDPDTAAVGGVHGA